MTYNPDILIVIPATRQDGPVVRILMRYGTRIRQVGCVPTTSRIRERLIRTIRHEGYHK